MILTPKVDVYCFGVLILELIHGEYLDDMKKKYSFADEDVLDQRPSAPTELEKLKLANAYKLGRRCVKKEPDGRPTMKDIFKNISQEYNSSRTLYLLAEAGDTLFAYFIGTKKYNLYNFISMNFILCKSRDVVADANMLRGAIFHEDIMEVAEEIETVKSEQHESRKGNLENLWNPLESKSKQLKDKSKPATHRGFLARAKGIPALDYRLAQKKKRKLVLCGHSPSPHCFNRKGWHHYFKSYCIPEDLVPRILSPAYFHHYNGQAQSMPSDAESTNISMLKREEGIDKLKEDDGKQLVLGLGPVQSSFWRLSRLVPFEGVMRQLNK
ncbi:putative leucine-rich repeat receptor-like protein kinase [Quercus suber]|uniref:Leucine-rich repeat receptor-like protein kinase n=1 Tax=Quercus suber TaxID=58331 RepID=A0AAW0IDD4_QUESU